MFIYIPMNWLHQEPQSEIETPLLSQTWFAWYIQEYKKQTQALLDIDISSIAIPQDVLDLLLELFAQEQTWDQVQNKRWYTQIVQFLYTPQPGLHYQTPITILHSWDKEAINKLKNFLGGILYGTYL